MSIRKVEGCAWHVLVKAIENNEDRMAMTQFSQLLSLHKADAQQTEHYTSQSPVVSHWQRYRVIGGIADGLMIEISEQQGVIEMVISVHHEVLFTVLNKITDSLVGQLQQSGFNINLEITHVNCPA